MIASGERASRHSLDIAINRGYPVALTGGVLPTAFRMDLQIALKEDAAASPRERWRVTLLAYRYVLIEPSREREWLAFHWHPRREGADHPHLHPGSAILSRLELAGRHIPTGHITLADVLTFAIAELGVQPERADWQRVLAKAHAALAGT
ncbi:MAG TPA: hypothetical protein VKV26_25185 [Dehalococcoidia bacterium]|nr:hypothetical protein [Dehalococcoidia bacterium]